MEVSDPPSAGHGVQSGRTGYDGLWRNGKLHSNIVVLTLSFSKASIRTLKFVINTKDAAYD